MSLESFQQIVLCERPVTEILSNTFESKTKGFDELHIGKQQTLVQVTYLSLDPAMRMWLRDTESYIPPVKIGEVMRAIGLGVVLNVGEGSKFKKGDLVHGALGWTEFVVMNDEALQKISPPSGATALDFLHTLGMPGMTAYFGLHNVGQLKAGETLVVSGAAGAVGSLVCQLGKKAGARVIGIAGAADKCAWLENDLGVEKALNYKRPTFHEDFKEAVGSLDALTTLNMNARVVICGAISAYNSAEPKGLVQYPNLIVKRAKIEGFIFFDYAEHYPRAIEVIAAGLADGSIKRKFHIVDGLQSAPRALPMLFSGENTGKLIVKVSDEPRAFSEL